MTLAEQILARHDGIREVLVLEERAGQHVVTEEAAKDDVPTMFDNVLGMRRNVSMIPGVILGAATQFEGEPSSLRLVGILYGKGGVLFSNLNNDRLLIITTSPESFFNVMQILNEVLPGLLEAYDLGMRTKGTELLSASDAERIARVYVSNRAPKSASILIDTVSYQEAKHMWDVKGSYRLGWSLNRHFQCEVDAYKSSLVGFTESENRSVYSSILFYVEVGSLVAAFSLLAWIVVLNLGR
jgi:hypothetical protein